MGRLLPMAVSVLVCLTVEVGSAAAQSPAAIANVTTQIHTVDDERQKYTAQRWPSAAPASGLDTMP